jgi:hypothetical protein
MGFVGLLLKDKKNAAQLAAELELDAEEIALLLGSTSATKKVQVLFEEAQKIREAETIEEIELAWHGTAQRSFAPAPAHGGETLEISAEAEPTQVAESSLLAAPEVVAGPAGPAAAKSEAKKRGRPRKAESEAKAEIKTAPEAKTEAVKRQKSLFDF